MMTQKEEQKKIQVSNFIVTCITCIKDNITQHNEILILHILNQHKT